MQSWLSAGQEPTGKGQALLTTIRRKSAAYEGVSLLFRAGSRPGREQVARLIEAGDQTGVAATLGYGATGDDGGLELLAGGLTFDLVGLAPAKAAVFAGGDHLYGFEDASPGEGLEAVQLFPSGHIAAGAGLDPVLRAMAGLAANLTLHLGASAVSWHSAGTVMEARYFSRIVFNWLSGGAFPALGLTALVPGPDGGVSSSGLAFFTGQELQLEAYSVEPQAQTLKLAARLVDWLMRSGPLEHAQTIEAGDVRLLAEPSKVGKLVLVWREG